MDDIQERLEHLFGIANIAVYACNMQKRIAPVSVVAIDESTYEIVYVQIDTRKLFSPIYVDDEIFELDQNVPLAFMSELESRILNRREYCH